jgi:hypothetical protein
MGSGVRKVSGGGVGGGGSVGGMATVSAVGIWKWKQYVTQLALNEESSGPLFTKRLRVTARIWDQVHSFHIMLFVIF